MDYSVIIYRIAVDRKGKELGRILRIDDLPGKIFKKLKPHVIIFVVERYKDDIKVPLDVKLLIKTED